MKTALLSVVGICLRVVVMEKLDSSRGLRMMIQSLTNSRTSCMRSLVRYVCEYLVCINVETCKFYHYFYCAKVRQME